MSDPVEDSPVDISIPGLVRLQRYSSSLNLNSGRILAQQSGDNQSAFKGRGMEFSESRAYAAGDDVRNLDWRVMARTGEPYTKLFREERERPVFFWVDFRAPMFFATRGMYKSVLAAKLASILAWSASAHSDRVGGVIFSDQQHHELKPQRGKRGVLKLIRALVNQHEAPGEEWRPDNSTLAKSLLRLRRVAKPGSLIFLLSDFRGMNEAAEQQLTHLGRHCEIVMLFISDPIEHDLPEQGYYRMSNGFSERQLDTSDQKLLHDYREHFSQRWETIQKLAGRNRARCIDCSTITELKDLSRFILRNQS